MNTPLHPFGPSTTSRLAQAFSAFLLRPGGMRFATQQQDEQIILLLRRHVATNIPWIAIATILLGIPVGIFPFLLDRGSAFADFSSLYLGVITVIWYLFSFSYILVNFLFWYFNVSIVTNKRIIDIDLINVVYKEFSATTIDKIEDVTSRRGGFFGLVFDYGDVQIQTAAAREVFEFLSVPRPEDVVHIINQLMESRLKRTPNP